MVRVNIYFMQMKFWLIYSNQFSSCHVLEALLNHTFNVMTGLMEEEQA